MKKLILLLLLVVTTIYGETDTQKLERYTQELYKLDKSQMQILKDILLLDIDKGFELEMATLAWKESNFGKWMINITDGKYGSFGLYHIRLDYALVRNKITSSWGKSRYTEKLLYDFELSSNEAVTLLLYWHNYHRKNNKQDVKKYMFASYNGGYKLSKQAIAYGEDAILRLEALRKFISDPNIVKVINYKIQE